MALHAVEHSIAQYHRKLFRMMKMIEENFLSYRIDILILRLRLHLYYFVSFTSTFLHFQYISFATISFIRLSKILVKCQLFRFCDFIFLSSIFYHRFIFRALLAKNCSLFGVSLTSAAYFQLSIIVESAWLSYQYKCYSIY